jgi:hypothetical protein
MPKIQKKEEKAQQKRGREDGTFSVKSRGRWFPCRSLNQSKSKYKSTAKKALPEHKSHDRKNDSSAQKVSRLSD